MCQPLQLFKVGRSSDPGTIIGEIQCTDEDVDSVVNQDWGKLSYAITGGNVGGTFLLTDSVLRVGIVSSQLGQVNFTFALAVTASDRGGLSASSTVHVNVINSNKNPIVGPVNTLFAWAGWFSHAPPSPVVFFAAASKLDGTDL